MNYLYDRKGRKVLFVTVGEFAHAFMVTRQAVWQWIDKKAIPAMWVGDREHGFHIIPWIAARDVIYRETGVVPRKSY